ncbi:hypothetical protein HDU91_006042 [Kappamyces sp. JEL0680]|nr:hypothetical protein HDU91_006042 [Kappamyces sp. JEL0680]
MDAQDAARIGFQKALQEKRKREGGIALETFAKGDTDHSGQLSMLEFRELVYAMGHYLSDAECSIAFASIDLDSSGEISYEEFLKWFRKEDRFEHLRLDQRQTVAVNAASQYFQYFDRDNNGSIDKVEFEALFKDMQKNGYFAHDASMNETRLQISGTSGHQDGGITFNDYILWLLRMGAITHFVM